MIDYLSLTCQLPPDKDYMEYHGKITEDSFRSQMYKFMCQIERARILYYPHKFGDSTNAAMPFTNIILNPKYYICYEEMVDCLFSIFDTSDLIFEDFNISGIHLASDIDTVNVETVIATLHVKRIRLSTFRIIKGTIYAGANPKSRIYNKLKEIEDRMKGGKRVTEEEKGLLELYKVLTRFEIAIGSPGMNLSELREKATSLVSYFDRLEFIRATCDSPCGVMQYMYRHMNRKFRQEVAELKDKDFVEKIKNTYSSGVDKWFEQNEPF